MNEYICLTPLFIISEILGGWGYHKTNLKNRVTIWHPKWIIQYYTHEHNLKHANFFPNSFHQLTSFKLKEKRSAFVSIRFENIFLYRKWWGGLQCIYWNFNHNCHYIMIANNELYIPEVLLCLFHPVCPKQYLKVRSDY